LLTKTSDAETRLKEMFRGSGQALITHTRLSGTALYRTDPDTDTFVQFYPFLPHHFDLLLELIRTLARSAGGIGLRSAIKVIQDVLVDVNRLLPAGTTKLAERPAGTLACADDFYNTLRNDIYKVLPHVVAAVERTAQIFSGHPLTVRVAKAVAAMQTVEGFPCSAENIAALLYPSVGAPSLLAEVREALRDLLATSEIGLVEDPKAGGYVFLSDKVRPLQKKRGDMPVLSGDTTRIRNEVLKKIFDPQPAARLENTKEVKAAVRSGKFLIVGDGEDMAVRLEWVDDSLWDTRRTALLTDTAAQPEWQNAVAWLVRNNDTVEELLPEIYRSEQIALQIDERSADRDEAQYLRAQLKQAEGYRSEVERLLRQALMGGTLIFRGRPTPAAEAGNTIEAAARTVLGRAAQDVFKYYHLAPVRAGTDLAGKFLTVDRFDRITPEQDPLTLVAKKGGSTQVNVGHPALAETLRAFEDRLQEVGGGRLWGNAIQDFFAGPPYGWSKDTVRYLFAALLVAGKIEFHTADGTLRVAGPKAGEACRSTLSFNRVGVSLRGAPPDPEALDRAAKCLQSIFGDTAVIPFEDSISRSVRRNLPGLLEAVGALPDRLRLLMLPGEERALTLKSSLTNALSGDATDAGAILGAKESTFAEDVRWARALLKAFEEDAETSIRRARQLQTTLATTDMLYPDEARRILTDSERDMLRETLSSERFHERLADVRSITQAALNRAETRYTETRGDLAAQIEQLGLRLEAHIDWLLLTDEDRNAIMDRLQANLPTRTPTGDPVQALTALLVRQTGLAGLERDLSAEIVRRLPVVQPPLNGEGVPEVEQMGLAVLHPPAVITSEAELDEWLRDIRGRLVSILRTRKHIKFEVGE